MHAEAEGNEWSKPNIKQLNPNIKSYLGCVWTLPSEVQVWASIDLGDTDTKNIIREVMHANDRKSMKEATRIIGAYF